MTTKPPPENPTRRLFPRTLSLLESDKKDSWRAEATCDLSEEEFLVFLSESANLGRIPPYAPDLARLEQAVRSAENSWLPAASEVSEIMVNPSLSLVRTSWTGLTSLPAFNGHGDPADPGPAEELILVWKRPWDQRVLVRPATDDDLLALKLVVEERNLQDAAREARVAVKVMDASLDRAVRKGILQAPPSGIRRTREDFPLGKEWDEEFVSAQVFTLQWHVTQRCDLHCKHCYDRSEREAMDLNKALVLLDDFHDFCRTRNVRGQVSFSGGNPLLYPQFSQLYRAAAERGFGLAILGNPAPKHHIKELLAIEPLLFFQVSLEGLPEHNDYIRGAGHFDRVMNFLKVLRELNVYSMVMLTLTRENLPQVLPLAEVLRNHVDLFTFNRLSLVGEGANLLLPTPEDFHAFLSEYLEASLSNPILGLKDNLLETIRLRKGLDPFGGCTGFGCGAAFNFMSVLPDGEAHACRKFPSPLGNVFTEGLTSVYESQAARKYRAGSRACHACELRPVCGGCLAVTSSLGLDPFQDRDPFCPMD